MPAKQVGVNADGTLTCGHSRAVGQPGAGPREWYCEVCGSLLTAQLDQEIAALTEWATQPDETRDWARGGGGKAVPPQQKGPRGRGAPPRAGGATGGGCRQPSRHQCTTEPPAGPGLQRRH